jgi:hypothetical protein
MYGRRGLTKLALGVATGATALALTATPAVASSVIRPPQATDAGTAETDSSVIKPEQMGVPSDSTTDSSVIGSEQTNTHGDTTKDS